MHFFKSLNPFSLCTGTNNNKTNNKPNKTPKNPNTNSNNENKEKIKILLRPKNWFYKLLFFQNPFKLGIALTSVFSRSNLVCNL